MIKDNMIINIFDNVSSPFGNKSETDTICTHAIH